MESQYKFTKKNVDFYFEELARIMVSEKVQISELFKFLDKDNSGTLTKDEMKKCFLKYIKIGINE